MPVATKHHPMTSAASVRIVRTDDPELLADLFASIQEPAFHPHPMTAQEAATRASYRGADVYAVVEVGGRLEAYGMLRGWDEGYDTPSLGIAVRSESRSRGYGRLMMSWLEDEARRRGAITIRLRVSPTNQAARSLYLDRGFVDSGIERGEVVMVLDLVP